MLCEKCSNIHFRRLVDCNLAKVEPNRDVNNETSDCVFYIHHKSRHVLQQSSENGCHFCAMLFDRLFHERDPSPFSQKYLWAKGEIILRRSVMRNWLADENGFEIWNTDDWIYVQCEDRATTSASHVEYPGLLKRMLNALTACKSLAGEEDKSMNDRITISEGDSDGFVESELDHIPMELLHIESDLYSPWIDASTISLPNMLLASFWLQTCLRKHTVCTDFQTKGLLPNRIIDIRNPQTPILHEGSGRDEPYITLSYKWGESRKYLTTTENLERHTQQGIPLNELPQTFKDAFFVASSLGFRWIWIDALCICQDSPDEQLREINKMDQTFRNSTLTMFATAGDSADTGLMSSRDPRWVKPCKLTIKTTLEGKTAEGRSYITLDGGEVTKTPLYNRGWVLQEQVLAHRGLIFESRQLRWQCLCGSASEGHPAKTILRNFESVRDIGYSQYKKWIDYPKGHDGFNHLRMWIQRKNPMPDRTPWQRENHFDAWYSMVTDYNTRALSYETDVLSALAGLANALATTHGDTYFAGLWKEDLQTGLCWYVSGSDYSNSDVQVASNQSSPSWTWIAQRGKEIEFRGWENNHKVAKHEGVSFFEHWMNGLLKSEDQFSTIRPKALLLTGRMRKLAVERISKDDYEWKTSLNKTNNDLVAARWVWRVRDIKTNEELGHIAFDSDPVHFETRDIYCLLCIAREKYGEWQLTGLGLVPTDDTLEEFRRIGLVMLRPKNWFGELHVFDPDEKTTQIRRPSKDIRFVRTVRLV